MVWGKLFLQTKILGFRNSAPQSLKNKKRKINLLNFISVLWIRYFYSQLPSTRFYSAEHVQLYNQYVIKMKHVSVNFSKHHSKVHFAQIHNLLKLQIFPNHRISLDILLPVPKCLKMCFAQFLHTFSLPLHAKERIRGLFPTFRFQKRDALI